MPPDRSEDDSAITRRRLLQAGAAVGLAGTIAGSPFAGAANAAGEDYDYVVIGTGAGGAPVAANLAEAGFKVLVLEAGPPHGNQNYYRAPILEARTEEDPAISWAFFVRHYTDTAAHGDSFKADKGGVFYPRASTLGGCMAHHFNVIAYGEHSDWETLRRLTGDEGFHPNRMWEHWERVRTWQPIESIVPLALAKDLPLVSLIAAAQLERLSMPPGNSAIGLSPNDRINVDRMAQGVYLTPQGTRGGVRVGPRERLLAVAQKHSNLTIVTNALAEKIVFERGPEGKRRAAAVRYLEGENLYAASPLYRRRSRAERRSIRRSVRVRREVIVAGGAFNSPQLLMLSGIGPKAHLERHGISVNVDLPGVGTNLQDRVETAVISQYEQEWSVGDGCMFDDHDDPCFTRWDNASNKSLELYSSNGVVAWNKRRYSKGPARPELVIFGGPLNFKYFEPGFSNTIAGRPFNHSTWAILKAYARGRAGTVRLRSKDPTAVPRINKRSLEDNTPGTYDVAALMEGVAAARRINSRVPFAHKEVFPGPGVTDIDLHIRRNQFGHHASCTNPIGSESDARAVLDGKLRVRGTTNVRVVDASSFPRIPGVFIAAPIMVLAEKASHNILDDVS